MGKIADLFVKLGLKNKEFDDGLKKSEKKVSSFSKGLSRIGGLIASAFAADQIISFTKDVIKLTAEAEGVEKAFNRIGGQDYFEDIKAATRGTVSNLELMRKTVSAQQLGVPVENLAKLFEFATQRASDTGESVDFLVNSIVVGIGRKSPLILDNLGISAIALKEKLDGVGLGTASVGDVAEAVGKIAEESLSGIGDAAVTTAQRMQQLSAQWGNLKISIGQSGIVEYFGGILKEINRLIQQTTRSEFQKALDPILGDIAIEGTTPEKRIKAINAQIEAQTKLRKNLIREANPRLIEGAFASAAEFEAEATKRLVEGTAERKGAIKDYNVSIKVTERLQKELSKATEAANKAEGDSNKVKAETINGIKAEIEALEKIQGDASGENLANINREIEALKEKKKALEDLGTATAEVRAQEQAPVVAATQGGIVAGVEGEGLPTTITTEGTFGQQILDDQAAFLAAFKSFNDQAAQFATDFIADTVEVFAQGLGELFAGDFNAEDFGKLLLQGIGNFLTTLGKMMIQFGTTALVYSTLAKALANPATAAPAAVAMIAAGAALVAIGSAIGSFAGGGGSGSTGTGAITTIDTRGTANTSNTLQQVEVQPVEVMVKGEISNKTIALSNNLGQKDLRR